MFCLLGNCTCFSFSGHHRMLLPGGPQMNEYKQVSSYHPHVTRCLMPRRWGYPSWPFLYHVTYPMMRLELPPLPMWTDRCLWKHYLSANVLASGNEERFDKDNKTCGYYFEVTFYSINMITEQSSITFTRPWHVEQIYCELHLERKFLQLSKVCMINLWFIFK